MKRTSIALRIFVGLCFLASAYYFGYTTRLLGDTVYDLFSGVTNVAAVNIPVSIVVLLFTTTFVSAFFRPSKQLFWLYGGGLLAMLGGWALLNAHMISFVLLALGWGASYWTVEQDLANNVRFHIQSLTRGWWWLKIAMIVVICTGVLWGGQRYMSHHELTKPQEHINRVAEYLSERLPENQLGLSTTDVSAALRKEMDRAFDTFITPQQQNFVWMIVLVLFIPLLLVFIPLGWLVLGLLWGTVYLGKRFGFLEKEVWEIEAERIHLL